MKTENAIAVLEQNFVQLSKFSGFLGETSVYVLSSTAVCTEMIPYSEVDVAHVAEIFLVSCASCVLSLWHGGSSECEQWRLPADECVI
jgi:hypothetical protein